MSDHSHAIAPPQAEKIDARHVGGLPNLLLGAGVVGIAASVIGLFISREQFAFSWLFGFTYFFTICIGALFWTCLHHATDAEWSVVVRRQLENVAKLLPYFALFLLPLLFLLSAHGADGEGILLKWWHKLPGEDPILDAKSGYLNHPFFFLRVIAYFVALGGIATWLWTRSTSQDADGAAKHTITMRKLGIAGIPALALCITFFGIDWLMGLDYHWFSTMWGVYLFAGAAGSSMATLILIVTTLKSKGYLKVVNEEHYHIMGKFLLAFSIFWAYIGFSQYMLIWYANIPEETIYFRIRNTDSWWYFSQFLVIGRFFLPFPVLLLQFTKKSKLINFVAGWILLMQMLDVFVIVLPALHPTGVRFGDLFLSACSLVGIGGILGWLFLKNIGKSYLFPTRDPRLAGSLKLTN
jgi:hypothetical protein